MHVLAEIFVQSSALSDVSVLGMNKIAWGRAKKLLFKQSEFNLQGKVLNGSGGRNSSAINNRWRGNKTERPLDETSFSANPLIELFFLLSHCFSFFLRKNRKFN